MTSSNLGKVIQVKKEDELDILTLISACGPAIASYFIKLLSDYGNTKGIAPKQSVEIASNTFEGTLRYLKAKNIDLESLINLVATKGGITEEILQSLDENDIHKIVFRSFDRGYTKIKSIKD